MLLTMTVAKLVSKPNGNDERGVCSTRDVAFPHRDNIRYLHSVATGAIVSVLNALLGTQKFTCGCLFDRCRSAYQFIRRSSWWI